MRAFLRWWLMICVIVIATIILNQFDIFSKLYETDQSKISFIIIAIFNIITTYIGVVTYKLSKGLDVTNTEITNCWFFADECQTLGLIGTVIGFIIMIGFAFNNLDVEDTESIQSAIKYMSIGMGSALVTTLVGMTASVLLKLQLININHDNR